MRISFDSVSEIYDETRKLPEDVGRRLIQTLGEELRSSRSILDAGVGTGRFANPLQDLGFKVVGIDISRKMLCKAQEKGAANLMQVDTSFLPFRDKVFDAVICVHLLHLIKEWKETLQEICRVTKDFMFSLHYVQRNPIRDAYKQMLIKHGYGSKRPGKSEQEIAGIVPPFRSVFVA